MGPSVAVPSQMMLLSITFQPGLNSPVEQISMSFLMEDWQKC